MTYENHEQSHITPGVYDIWEFSQLVEIERESYQFDSCNIYIVSEIKETALMSYRESVTASAVSEKGNVKDGCQADDIERAETVSSADQSLNPRKQRSKLFLKVLQKVNMCFLVIFIGYFAWTISVNYSHSGVNNGVTWNNSAVQNATLQVRIMRNNIYILNWNIYYFCLHLYMLTILC